MAAEHQVDQSAGPGGIEVQEPVGQPGLGRGRILFDAPHGGAEALEVFSQSFLRVPRVLSLQETDPTGLRQALQVPAVHRPQVDFHQAADEQVGCPAVPLFPAAELVAARVPVHLGNHEPAVDDLLLSVNVVHLTAQGVDVTGIARQEVGVAETRPTARREVVPMGDPLDFPVEDGEIPSIGSLVPLAAILPADGAVQTDIGGDVAPVGLDSLLPGIHVLQGPLPVFRLPGEHVGVEGQIGGRQVERMVSHAVEVFVAVSQHLGVDLLQVQHLAAAERAVQDVKAAGDRISHPIVGGGLAEHGALAAVPDAADDPVLGVVVGRLGILVHVESGEALHALPQPGRTRFGKPLEHEPPHPFPGMEPVRHGDEFSVVGALPGQVGQGGSELAILVEVPLQRLLEQLQNGVGCPQRMEQRPVVKGLDGVVGSVQSPPAGSVQQVAALIHVLGGEDLAGFGVEAQQLAFHQRPGRWGHRTVQHQRRVFRGHGPAGDQPRQQQGEEDS